MASNYYVDGQYNIICDSCGWKKKISQVRRRWDGLMVCKDTCWEMDHPQKYIRIRETGIAVDPIRDDPSPTYLDVCYIYASQSYSGISTSGCMRSGLHQYTYQFLVNLMTPSPSGDV